MRTPAIFLGHGSPMNAIEQNQWSESWRALGRELTDVKGVLCVSAHWYTRGCGVTAMTTPRTIHDFGGFPQELFEVVYPAGGDPALAQHTKSLLAGETDEVLDESWGLDHGTWSVLVHLFPDANVPVVQLSIDATLDHEKHIEYGRRISELRDLGYLIIGSGNIVHNLHESFRHQDASDGFEWAKSFDTKIKARLVDHDFYSLADYDRIDDNARLSVPTPDHYLPLLYVVGTAAPDEPIDIVCDGFQWGGISMTGVKVG